jgi:hypothetical protein
VPLVPLKPFKVPRRAAAAQVAQPFTVPAPVGGLNYRDPITAMAATDAVVLTNLIPRQQGVELRKGWKEHSDAVEIATVPQSAESVFSYKAPNPANDKVFMAAAGNIYDVTAGGAPTVAVSTTGSSSDDWWTTQFSTAADTFLLAVSPGAGYWTYSTSSGWVNRTATTVGLSVNVRTVAVWKRRIWFTVSDDPQVYYMRAVDQISGHADAFPMGSLLRNGGYVSALTNWTIDAGVSVDDYLVAVGTEGDVGVWEGTDPSSANTFGLKGVWYVGPVPTYGRYFTQVGGDVMIVSELGLVPMSRLFTGQFSSDAQGNGPAAKIQSVFAPLVKRLRGNKRWDVSVVSSARVLLISLPVDGGVYRQFAMDTTTGAWCEFENLPIRCVTVIGGELYFGTVDGPVCRGLYGSLDGAAQDGTGGVYPLGEAQCAFNAFGSPAQLKTFHMARTIFIGSAAPSVQVSMNTQFVATDSSGAPAFSDPETALWDTGIWNLAVWVASNNFQAWHGTAGLGYYGSLRLKLRGTPGTTFLSANVLSEIGGVM